MKIALDEMTETSPLPSTAVGRGPRPCLRSSPYQPSQLPEFAAAGPNFSLKRQ